MAKAIRVHQYGGPEAMVYEDIPTPEPGPGQIRVRQTAIGVNFIDIYFRSGLYKAASLPFTLGKEGAGVVDALGEGVTDFRVGERVAYAGAVGTYAEEVVVDTKGVVHVPDAVPDETAAAMMLKGLTAHYLLRLTYRVQPATRSCSTRRPAASASSPRNGPSTSAPPSSAPSARRKRRSWPRSTAATTSSSTATRISPRA